MFYCFKEGWSKTGNGYSLSASVESQCHHFLMALSLSLILFTIMQPLFMNIMIMFGGMSIKPLRDCSHFLRAMKNLPISVSCDRTCKRAKSWSTADSCLTLILIHVNKHTIIF